MRVVLIVLLLSGCSPVYNHDYPYGIYNDVHIQFVDKKPPPRIHKDKRLSWQPAAETSNRKYKGGKATCTITMEIPSSWNDYQRQSYLGHEIMHCRGANHAVERMPGS